jgi:hypothetical protein
MTLLQPLQWIITEGDAMNKIRRCALGFSSVVAFALFATAGFAAGPSDAEKRASCGGDVMRLCFSSIGSDAGIEGCLRAHRPQLSGTCKALFDKYDPQRVDRR